MFGAVDVEWKKVLKFLSAAVAGLLAIPGMVRAQAQKMTSDWLQLTPSDGKSPITASRASVTTDDDATTVSIERRSSYRSRSDSVAATRALEASKRDEHLHIVVSLDDKKLWVVAGEGRMLAAAKLSHTLK